MCRARCTGGNRGDRDRITDSERERGETGECATEADCELAQLYFRGSYERIHAKGKRKICDIDDHIVSVSGAPPPVSVFQGPDNAQDIVGP